MLLYVALFSIYNKLMSIEKFYPNIGMNAQVQ